MKAGKHQNKAKALTLPTVSAANVAGIVWSDYAPINDNMKPPHIGKAWYERRTTLPASYAGDELHLHSLPDREWCAFGAGLEIYVHADSRQEAKQAARRKTPSWFGNLNWKK